MAVMDATGYVGVLTIYLVAEYGDFANHLDVFNSVGQLFGWIMLALWVFTSVYFFILRRKAIYAPPNDDEVMYGEDDTGKQGSDEYGVQADEQEVIEADD